MTIKRLLPGLVIILVFLLSLSLPAIGEVSTCQPSAAVPGDVDLGVSFDEQQGGGGLVGENLRILNGNTFVSRADIFFALAHRMGLGFSAYYNNQSPAACSLGVGWSHTYSVSLNPGFKFGRKTYIRIVDATGRGYYFRQKASGVSKGAFHERSHVTADPDGFTWHRLNGSRYDFSQSGQLAWIDDKKGNRLQIGYDGQQRLDTVTDLASGRMLTFNCNANDLIESIAGSKSPMPMMSSAPMYLASSKDASNQ